MKAIRFDTGELQSPQIRHDGTLRADAFLTRTGVFVYRRPTGEIIREYRPPEEVFKADSMASLHLVPLTMDHPAGGVSANNARAHTVGNVGQDARQDDKFLRSTIAVNDRETVNAMINGKNQLSCGYHCDVDNVSGVTTDGERYDAIQKNIVYNHVAVVERGRAGPMVRARMDAYREEGLDVSVEAEENKADNCDKMKIVTPSPSARHGEILMKYTLKVDGIEFALEGEKNAIQALEAQLAKIDEADHAMQELRAGVEKEVQEAQAKADVAEKELEKLQKQKQDAEDALPELVKARVALEKEAANHIKEVKADASDREIKEAVIAELQPEISLDGKEDSYVDAVFDSAVLFAGKAAKVKHDAATDKRKAAEVTSAPTTPKEDVEDIRAKHRARMDNMASQKISSL